MKNIMIIDDKENILKVLKVIIEKDGYAVEVFHSAKEAWPLIKRNPPNLIISDIRMEEMDGKELFLKLRKAGLSIPCIFMTAYGTIHDAVALMKDGAVDYMTKPLDYDQLKKRIRALLSKDVENGSSHGLSETKYLVGSGPVMQAIYERINLIADVSSTVLITGESGTGKELIARAIHQHSKRRAGPFFAVNCSSFNENLLESELFGHEKGAFTDAVRKKNGIFEVARGGTLFLDEIAELTLATQAKLLRVLQEKVFTRLGGTTLIQTDVRVIAATNKNLEQMLEKHVFREDLYYRLHVIPFMVPPLREHPEDIRDLVVYFSHQISRREGLKLPLITDAFVRKLREYDWPGNIRELENLVERIMIMYRPSEFQVRFLQEQREFLCEKEADTMDDRSKIVETLLCCNGNKSAASRMLGVSRRNLYYKIERYAIDPTEYSQGC